MKTVAAAGFFPHPPVVVPAVGGAEAKEVLQTARAMDKLSRRLAQAGGDVLVVITPHGTVFRDAVAIAGSEQLSGTLARFGARGVGFTVENDLELVSEVQREAGRANIPVALPDKEARFTFNDIEVLDHGTLVPLYFLSGAGIKLPLLHITFGLLSIDRLFAFGQAVSRALGILGRKAAVVASGDLSHRLEPGAPGGYSPVGVQFDRELMKLLESNDISGLLSMDANLVEEAGECGYRSLVICLGILDAGKVHTEILSYEAPFGVGYLVADLMAVDKEGKGSDKTGK